MDVEKIYILTGGIADIRKAIAKKLFYIFEVKDSTEKIINSLSYDKLKKKVSEERKEHLKLLNVVNNDENAIWLIDYWCGKDIRGLIQMPFSRHWIMHIEASLTQQPKSEVCKDIILD